MTTIAYRDGVMASDSGSWNGDACHGWARKLARATDGTLYGVSGSAAKAHEFLRWVDGGQCGERPTPGKVGDRGDFIVLICKPDDDVILLTHEGEEHYQAPYFAVGAAAAVAFGAMHAGATAWDAIAAANEHGEGCHGAVQVISSDAGTRVPRIPIAVTEHGDDVYAAG